MKNRLLDTNETEAVHRLARITEQVEGIRQHIEAGKCEQETISKLQSTCLELRSIEIQILQKHMRNRAEKTKAVQRAQKTWEQPGAFYITEYSY